MFSGDVHHATLLVVDNEYATVEAIAAALRNEGFMIDLLVAGSAGVRTQDGSLDVLGLNVVLFNADHDPTFRPDASRGDRPQLTTMAATSVTDSAPGAYGHAHKDASVTTRRFSLLERVAAKDRREYQASMRLGDGNLHFADVTMNPESHQVWRGHNAIELSAREFILLRYFLENPGRVIPKAEIIDHVWRVNRGNSVIENYISYLRRKLGAYGPPLIHTQRHVGYVLRNEAEGIESSQLATHESAEG